MTVSDSLYEPDQGDGSTHMPAQRVDCFIHGRAPSIDPNTGRPPVYRKERLVPREVTYTRPVYDERTKECVPVSTVSTALERVPYGPELPAGGGVCMFCWQSKGHAVAPPAEKKIPSILGALAESLGMDPEELKRRLHDELLGKEQP